VEFDGKQRNGNSILNPNTYSAGYIIDYTFDGVRLMIVLRRLLDDLEGFSRIGKGPRGTTRLAYTDEWMKAQRFAKELLEAIGIVTDIDSVGNLTGIRKGRETGLPPVAVGSHLDTVPEGGNFDGALGVASAIEIMRALDEARVETKRSIQVNSFACEEGSRFGVGCIGSKFMVGELSLDSAQEIRDLNGATLSECIQRAHLPGTVLRVKKAGDLAAYVELHIEQGPVLENLNKPIGVVTGIAAPTRLLIEVRGRTGHVGTVPMKARKDALVAGAEIITGIEKTVTEIDESGVGTVSRIEMQPNSVTAIPGSVKLWVDLRYLDEEKRRTCTEGISRLAAYVMSKRKVNIELKTLTNEHGMMLSPRVINVLRQAADSFGYPYHEMPSGAMHDAAHMARITDVGMVFVPCRGGISHAPEEFADPSHIEKGLNVLHKTLLTLANQ
jgi:N-carbamoyl-L-amino-acid hydrolase